MTDRSALLHLCCNDTESGQWAGRLFAVEVRDELTLYGPDGGIALRRTDATLTVRRRTYPYRSWSTWVGNWCWDVAGVRLSDARAILLSAIRAGFTVESHAVEGPFADLVAVADTMATDRRATREKRRAPEIPQLGLFDVHHTIPGA